MNKSIFTLWNHIHICLFTTCVSSALRGQNNAPDLLDMEIQMVLTNLK